MDEDEKHSEFVEKFKPKLTTDDCYTPPLVLMRGTLDEKETKTTDFLIEDVVNSSIVCEKEKGEDDEEDD